MGDLGRPDRPDPRDLPEGVDADELPPLPGSGAGGAGAARGRASRCSASTSRATTRSSSPAGSTWPSTCSATGRARRGRAVAAVRRRAGDGRPQQAVHGRGGPHRRAGLPDRRRRSTRGRWPDAGSTGPDREPPELAELPMLLGDVVVCPAVAARKAPEHAGSYDDELALLVVHGVLHVLGMDHAEPEEAAAMQARERELLDRYHHGRPMIGDRPIGGWIAASRSSCCSSLSIVLAVAETALTRMSGPRRRRWPRRRASGARSCCRSWSTRSGSTPSCSSCCPPSSCSPPLLGVLASRLFGGWGVVGATVLNVTLFFVLAEVAPEDLGHPAHRPRRAGRRPARAGARRLLAAAVLSRGLIGLTNVILPGKGLKRGPVHVGGGAARGGRPRGRGATSSRPRSARSSSRSSSSATPSCAR